MLGDYNASIEDSFTRNFCENYDLRSLVKEPTCFKNPENPSCIDLILTNKPRSFIKTGVIETGLSDYHKLVTTVMQIHFPKSKASIITYRSYKKFDNKKFMENLNAEIITQSNYLEKDGIEAFSAICCEVLNKHAPQKQRYLRCNHKPFINAEISKEIMIRSRMRNRFLKHRSDENRRLFQKQRNKCASLLRKVKKEYFSSLNISKVEDNKSFWKIVKPFLSNKTISSEKKPLIDDEELITDEQLE